MSQQPPSADSWAGSALVIGSLAAQAALLVAGLLGVLPPDGALWGQLAVNIAVAASGVLCLRRPHRPSLAFYVISIAALGPLGLFGWLLMEAVRRVSLLLAAPAVVRRVGLAAPKSGHKRTLYQLLTLRGARPTRDSTVSPFADVIEVGTFEQKQSVVTLIADHFRPEFAVALRRALNDPEPAIRVQAATAVARIENRFLQRSVALEAARRAKPNDPVVLREVAGHHEAYARSGLLDAERMASEQRSAIALYTRLLETASADADMAAAAARLYLELGRPDAAIGVLAPPFEQRSITDSVAGPLSEALYRTGRFSLLRHLSKRVDLEMLPAIDAPLRDAIHFWSKPHA
jgi:polysaccharide biosynthesis protein PelE